MILTEPDVWSDREWALATDVHTVLRNGGTLSLRERQLEHLVGGADRALRLLCAVGRAEAHLDRVLADRPAYVDFALAPLRTSTAVASSGVTPRDRRTARGENVLLTVAAAGFAWSAVAALVVHR